MLLALKVVLRISRYSSESLSYKQKSACYKDAKYVDILLLNMALFIHDLYLIVLINECVYNLLLCSGIAVSMVMKYADNIVKVKLPHCFILLMRLDI